ncbi:Bifunctional purine biosynthesis protein PurH [Mucor velutinosus]|uniref:Bifunctional purine biosynthesis protein PurH n=1 Tax=Mucor velutinosus TaxID=708070 RepID=A0AAN7I3B8_9FUNG|nr:Bifunctional purine biosynthesis protein PurH [Mucor velutinosus]
MQFYVHRLQVRSNAGMLHYFGRLLLHQYVVDMYVKVEHRRLEYLRNNQGSLRTELYSGLTDAAVPDSTISTEEIGKQIILPSSPTGSPRSMQQLYQDSMAMVSSLGKPSYFITFTCNPNWPEIVNELRNGGLSPTDNRPDLCARVFDMKLKELISDIKTKPYIFGNVIGFYSCR